MIYYIRNDSDGNYPSTAYKKLDYTANNPDRDLLIKKTIKVAISSFIILLLLGISKFIITLIVGDRINNLINQIIFGIIFILIGIITFYIFIIDANKRKKRCTVKVHAEVYDVCVHKNVDSNHHRRYSYAPVYMFELNGTTYKVQSSTSSGAYNKNIGDMEDILVNPLNPIEIYMFDEDNHKTIIILGSLFIIIGLFLAVKGFLDVLPLNL